MKSESGEFLSNLFLVNKKNESHRPVKNLKFLDSIPYQHFKMEVMRLMKDLHQEKDLLIGMDLKDAFLAYLRAKAQESKFVSVPWENLCEFFYLYFGLGLSPLIFTKLLKILIALLKRINI